MVALLFGGIDCECLSFQKYFQYMPVLKENSLCSKSLLMDDFARAKSKTPHVSARKFNNLPLDSHIEIRFVKVRHCALNPYLHIKP